MIAAVDLVLRHALLSRIPGLTSGRIGFQPPNEAWRQLVGAQGMWVNCYLVDLREDRRLRQNVRERVTTGTSVSERRAPVRVRCQYLVSAWSGGRDAPEMSATEQEHTMLGAVVSALLAAEPLVPSAVLTPEQLLSVPEFMREHELPTELLPVDGFPKLAEFWGTMGRPAAWKPVVPLVVTVPVPEPEQLRDGVVRSVVASYATGTGVLAEAERREVQSSP